MTFQTGHTLVGVVLMGCIGWASWHQGYEAGKKNTHLEAVAAGVGDFRPDRFTDEPVFTWIVDKEKPVNSGPKGRGVDGIYIGPRPLPTKVE